MTLPANPSQQSESQSSPVHQAPIFILQASNFKLVLGSLFSGLLLVIGASYKAGDFMASATATSKILEMQAVTVKAQTQLTGAMERNATLLATNEKLIRENAQLTQQLLAQSGQVAQLNSQLGSETNCAFIREQIRNLEAEVRPRFTLGIFGHESEKEVEAREQKERDRQASLNEKIARYQAQLGPGACK